MIASQSAFEGEVFRWAPAKVSIGGEKVDFTPELIKRFAEASNAENILLITGVERSGKSSLLRQACDWVRKNEHGITAVSPIPVLLDGRDPEQNWTTSLVETALRQLREQYPTSLARLKVEWFEKFIELGWIWLFIDHAEAVPGIDLEDWVSGGDHQEWKNILVTSTGGSDWDGSNRIYTLETRELDRDQIGIYWDRMLRNEGKSGVLDLDLYYDALKTFTGLMETGTVPLETVSVGLEWVICHADMVNDKAPTFPHSMLELFLWWARQCNEEIKKKRLADAALERVAQAVAWESVKTRYELSDFQKKDIYTSLSNESQISVKLDYLERKLRWLTAVDAEGRILKWNFQSLGLYLAGGQFQMLLQEQSDFLKEWISKWPKDESGKSAQESRDLARAIYTTLVQHPVTQTHNVVIDEKLELGIARLAGVTHDQAIRSVRRRRLNEVLDQLLNPETNDRTPILDSLREMGMDAKVAAEPLVRFALEQKQDLELRQAALEGLSALGPAASGVVEELAHAVSNPDEHLFFRLKMVEAIGNIGEKAFKIVHALVRLLNQESTQTFFKYQILETLGKIGPAAHESLSVIQRYTRSDANELKEAAEWAIQRIHGKQPPPLRKAVSEIGAGSDRKSNSLASLDSMGRWIQLARSLRDPETVDREQALKALKEGGEDARMATSEIVKISKDREADMEARQLALDALAELGARASDASSSLVKLAMDPDELIFYRIKAIETLGTIGEKAVEAAVALRSVCANSREQVFFRARIIENVAKLGNEGKRLAVSWKAEISEDDLSAGLSEAFESIGVDQ